MVLTKKVLLSNLIVLLSIPLGVQAKSLLAPTVTVLGQVAQELQVTAVNQHREADQLILYTANNGSSTRANPYGVEVTGKRIVGTDQYEVSHITNVWDCMKATSSIESSSCGNAKLDKQTVVLSASGKRRKPLLKALPIGARFKLSPQWFSQAQASVAVTDPNEINNPRGVTYPGFRASHQLLRYTSEYPNQSTQTNEYGYEVTVEGGRVTQSYGANSPIPPNGYVLSGHGRMRSWLIQHAPLGAEIQWDETTNTIRSTIDLDTYRLRSERLLTQLPENTTEVSKAKATIQQAQALRLKGQADEAAQRLSTLENELQTAYWKTLNVFPPNAVRGVWHRPVELSAEAVGATLDRLQGLGLNTVFLETFFHGYPIFPSQTYAEYELIKTQYPKFANFDPLRVWLDEAHKRNMKVHAWFQTFYVGNTKVDGLGPILSKHPEWANHQRSALETQTDSAELATWKEPKRPKSSSLELGHYFIDPANPAVQAFILNLIRELTTTYPDLDGLQLDYIRYPSSFPKDRYSYKQTTWGYTQAARTAFYDAYEIDPIRLDPKGTPDLWQQWELYKEGVISDFVRQVHQQLEEQQSETKLSVAVFPDLQNALMTKHQAWNQWLKRGWVDAIAPMNISTSQEGIKQTTNTIADIVETHPFSIQRWVGLFAPFNNLDGEQLLKQMQAAHPHPKNSEGFILFDSAHINADQQAALKAIKPSDKSSVLIDQKHKVEHTDKSGEKQSTKRIQNTEELPPLMNN